jgi:hypothetical protein
MSFVGGYGPEGMWPFANVMRPAPQGALPDCFRRYNVSRRLPFVNNISKDRTFLCKKRKYLLTHRFGSAILIGGRAGNLSGLWLKSTFLLHCDGKFVGTEQILSDNGGGEVVKLRRWEALRRPRPDVSSCFS